MSPGRAIRGRHAPLRTPLPLRIHPLAVRPRLDGLTEGGEASGPAATSVLARSRRVHSRHASPPAALRLGASRSSSPPPCWPCQYPHTRRSVPQRLLLQATTSEDARYSLRARPAAPGVARQKPVALDVRISSTSRRRQWRTLTSSCSTAQSVTLTPDRLERRADGNYTWYGKLKDHPKGFALITVVDGQVSGMIDLGSGGSGRAYQLHRRPTA